MSERFGQPDVCGTRILTALGYLILTFLIGIFVLELISTIEIYAVKDLVSSAAPPMTPLVAALACAMVWLVAGSH